MTQSPNIRLKHDRLAAFLKAFGLCTTHCSSAKSANLLIIDVNCSGNPTHLLYRAKPNGTLPDGATLCAAAKVDFGDSANPLIGALPDEVRISLAEEPQLLGLTGLIVAEVENARCGGRNIQARLCEVVVVLAIRKAIAIGTIDAGLLAGLAHPKLHMSLVAMHDDPMRNWQNVDLAAIAGMSRGQFIKVFKQTVGQSPVAYLNCWRLVLGRVELCSGRSVKSAAAAVGFGSVLASLFAEIWLLAKPEQSAAMIG
jgi:AraC-like DNA-binding protein